LVESIAVDDGAPLPDELRRLEEQFRAGEIELPRIVIARNSLLQRRRARLESLNEVAQAVVAVTAATGLPATALIAAPP
jgi:outer membrane protein, heavy metal efflux system